MGLHGVGTRLERLSSSSSSSRDCLCTVFCIFNVLLEFYFNFFFWSGNQLLNFFDQFSLKIFQSTNFCLHLINSFLLFSSQLLGLTTQLTWQYVFPSVQFSRSVMSDSLRPYGLQHARLPCPSPTPGGYSTHVHRVSDAIQPSHPLSSPSPSALNLCQHQGLFQ